MKLFAGRAGADGMATGRGKGQKKWPVRGHFLALWTAKKSPALDVDRRNTARHPAARWTTRRPRPRSVERNRNRNLFGELHPEAFPVSPAVLSPYLCASVSLWTPSTRPTGLFLPPNLSFSPSFGNRCNTVGILFFRGKTRESGMELIDLGMSGERFRESSFRELWGAFNRDEDADVNRLQKEMRFRRFLWRTGWRSEFWVEYARPCIKNAKYRHKKV